MRRALLIIAALAAMAPCCGRSKAECKEDCDTAFVAALKACRLADDVRADCAMAAAVRAQSACLASCEACP